MSPELKWMITIYIVAFIFMIIVALCRMKWEWAKKNMYETDSGSFFGIKNIWGWVHFILYTLLGYKCGIDLLPLAILGSLVWDSMEYIVDNTTTGIIEHSGMIDIFIDITGYGLGSYLRN